MKKLTMLISMLMATSAWAENDKRPQTEEEIEAWHKERALIDIKDSTQLSCNWNHNTYLKVGSVDGDVEGGEGTDYWYIKENVIYSKDTQLDHELILKAWRESEEHEWKGRDPAKGQTEKIIIDENQKRYPGFLMNTI